MKKLSKAHKQMTGETIGIDLGDKMSRYCIVNPQGEVVEEGNFPKPGEFHRNTFQRRGAPRCAGSGGAIGLDQPGAEAPRS